MSVASEFGLSCVSNRRQNSAMRNQFTAFIERGEKYLIATCPEVPEAHGQDQTREEALKDLTDSIRSVLEYRREEASAHAGQLVEQTVVELP